MPSTDTGGRGTSARSDTTFKMAVVGGVVVACLVTLIFRFDYAFELPPKPPKPGDSLAQAREVSDEVGRSQRAYRERIVRDSRELGLTEPATLAEMARAFPYRSRDPDVVLDPKTGPTSIEVGDLRLSIEVESIRRSYKKQMVLSIENTTGEPLAYRVVTRPTRGLRTCEHKRELEHDALTLAPGATARRSECLYKPGWGLAVRRVETVALPPLGRLYVSQLPPDDLGVSRRPARGPLPATGQPCSPIVPASVERALERGALGWRDAVDFYARHDCRNFTIPASYSAFEEAGERSLPVVGPSR